MEYNGFETKKESGFRSRFLIGVLAVLGVALIALAAVLITFGVRQSKYNSAIENANYYYTSGNYQEAIVWYESAIEIDEKKENAYINLASAYTLLGDYASANNAVERGLAVISSEKLEQKRVEIQTLVMNAAKAEAEAMMLTEDEIKSLSAEVGLENNAFDMVAAYTYTEYYRDFGNGSLSQDGEKIIVNYTSNGVNAFYYDINNEKVVDAQKNVPYANAKPVEVSFTNLHKLFASKNEKFVVSYAKLQELFGSTLQFHLGTDGMNYITAEYKNCRLYVETDANGNIISETAWNKIEPLKRGTEEFEDGVEGEVQGYVKDAMTGKGMRATLKIRERGKKVGSPLAELSSAGDGSYSYAGKAERYTVEVSAKGYITEYYDIEVIKNQVKTGEDMILTPEVGEGEIRIVLTWGSSPTDLDSYAIGTSSTGKNFNICYRNRTVNDVGNLDVDDTSSYGPETITITDIGSTFTYSVVDFRSEGTMGGCGATVKVYLPGESSAIEFKVPSGSGLLWEVFEYENGEIREINDLNDNVSRTGPK